MSAEKLSLGQQILEGLGGAGNIKVFENCMTRLRVVVVDPSKVDRAALGNIKGGFTGSWFSGRTADRIRSGCGR